MSRGAAVSAVAGVNGRSIADSGRMENHKFEVSREEHWVSGARSTWNFNSLLLGVSVEAGILIRCVFDEAVLSESRRLPIRLPFMKTVSPERLKSSRPEWLNVRSRYGSPFATKPGGTVNLTVVSEGPTPLMVRMP